MTRVVIAASTPMIRAGLRAMLAGADIEIAGETATLSRDSGDLSGVDVIILADDELLDERSRAVFGDHTLALVVLSSEDWVLQRLRRLPLRGWGLLPLDAPTEEIQAAIASAAQGLIVLPLPLAERLLGQRAAVESVNLAPLDEPLTPRELEVLELLSQGLSNKLIARQLQISEHTVKFHVSSLYAKLGASSRTEAVHIGARRGLIAF